MAPDIFMKNKKRRIDRMAAAVAEAIMTAPLDGKKSIRCQRVAFKAGKYPDNEIDVGGLCQSALEDIVADALVEFHEKE